VDGRRGRLPGFRGASLCHITPAGTPCAHLQSVGWKTQVRMPSTVVLFQKTLRIERGHTARAGAGDGLAIHMVLHVTCGEYTGH
jgi:hypothetical protein